MSQAVDAGARIKGLWNINVLLKKMYASVSPPSVRYICDFGKVCLDGSCLKVLLSNVNTEKHVLIIGYFDLVVFAADCVLA